MAVNLVTGHANKPHVSASDMAALYRGLTGQSGASMLMSSSRTLDNVIVRTGSNTVTVYTSDWLLDGYHVHVDTQEVTIQSASSGLTRYDCICLHYENRGGVESASLKVVQGSPSRYSASQPTVTGSILSGASSVDYPLAAVKVQGVDVQDSIIMLADAVATTSGMVGTVKKQMSTINDSSAKFTNEVDGKFSEYKKTVDNLVQSVQRSFDSFRSGINGKFDSLNQSISSTKSDLSSRISSVDNSVSTVRGTAASNASKIESLTTRMRSDYTTFEFKVPYSDSNLRGTVRNGVVSVSGVVSFTSVQNIVNQRVSEKVPYAYAPYSDKAVVNIQQNGNNMGASLIISSDGSIQITGNFRPDYWFYAVGSWMC